MADVVCDGDNRIVNAVQRANPLVVLPVGYITPRTVSFTVLCKINELQEGESENWRKCESGGCSEKCSLLHSETESPAD